MTDGPELIVAEQGDGTFDDVVRAVEYLRSVTAPIIASQDDIVAAESTLMTALCVFAGTILGTFIVAGIAKDQERKRVTDSMAKNFRSGIDVGKRRAMRVAREDVGGNA